MKDALELLDHVRLNYSTGNQFVINIALAFIMFGVALGIRIEDFRRIALRPKAFVVGEISQFVLLPAVTFVLVLALRKFITPTVAFGMILVASCPGGNISNFITSLAKGNSALSVSLTAFSTVGAIVITPLNFAFWGGLYSSASHFLRPIEIPVIQVFQTVFILLGIPLLVGLFVAWKFPKFTTRISGPIRIGSIVFFALLVVLALANNFSIFLHYIGYIFIIVLIHNAVSLSAGYFAGSVSQLQPIDRRTVAIETGIQNSGLALALLFNPAIFPPELETGGMVFVAAWWGIWHIVSGMAVAWFWGRRKPKVH